MYLIVAGEAHLLLRGALLTVCAVTSPLYGSIEPIWNCRSQCPFAATLIWNKRPQSRGMIDSVPALFRSVLRRIGRRGTITPRGVSRAVLIPLLRTRNCRRYLYRTLIRSIWLRSSYRPYRRGPCLDSCGKVSWLQLCSGSWSRGSWIAHSVDGP